MEHPRSPLESALKYKGGGSAVRAPGNQEFVNVHRDIARCEPLLVQEATLLTMEVFKDDPAAIKVLDTIRGMMSAVFAEGIANRAAALEIFRRLYDYLETVDAPRPVSFWGRLRQYLFPRPMNVMGLGWRVHATFCVFFLQAYHVYIFANNSTAMGLLDLEEQPNLNTMLNLLALVKSEGHRRELFAAFNENWPTSIDQRPFFRKTEDWLALIREYQMQREKSTPQ